MLNGIEILVEESPSGFVHGIKQFGKPIHTLIPGLTRHVDDNIKEFRHQEVLRHAARFDQNNGILEYASRRLGQAWNPSYPAYWYSIEGTERFWGGPHGWCQPYTLDVLFNATDIPAPLRLQCFAHPSDPSGDTDPILDFLRANDRWLAPKRGLYIPYDDLINRVRPGSFVYINNLEHIAIFIAWENFERNFATFFAIGGNQWHGRVVITQMVVFRNAAYWTPDTAFDNNHYSIIWQPPFRDGFGIVSPR
ncbi:MAG: hypothetical protein M5R36_09840 [Deltaproteobacteria bacterium]|nr:hypothetical protein [Deltaproteobacteria bacterium]